MPDKRTHRGPHPEDARLFADEKIPALRRAVADMSLLLTKGYAAKSSLKLVCDRFSLTERQRFVVMRCACSDEQMKARRACQICTDDLAGRSVVIDGYNLLITIEAALSGAPIFLARDGCFRDLASLHGSYRKVNETIGAIELIAGALQNIGVSHARWLFDSPVSNSGRLKTIIRTLAEEKNWPWEVELLTNPDAELIKTELIVASADSAVLDKCSRWTNLTDYIIKKLTTSTAATVKVVDLSTS